MTEVAPLWDFDDPVGSETRFRAAAAAATGTDRLVLLTQVARCLGLQEQYDEAGRVLDDVHDQASGSGEVAVRVELERGRLRNSASDPAAALPHFRAAAAAAAAPGLAALHVDALHMVALAVPPEERLRANQEALAVARASSDPAARDWDASVLNNLGMCEVDAGDLPAALTTFEEAVTARRRIGDDARTRVARWMVAWVLRLQGRTGEALVIQRALKEELDALGETDPYVDEELALLSPRD